MLPDHLNNPTAIRMQFGAIFVSLELSRKTWLITSLSPGKGEKMSKHSVTAGDIAGLLARFSELQRKTRPKRGCCEADKWFCGAEGHAERGVAQGGVSARREGSDSRGGFGRRTSEAAARCTAPPQRRGDFRSRGAAGPLRGRAS